MTASSVFFRTGAESAEHPPSTVPGSAPPPASVPGTRGRWPWPASAKLLVAVLLAAATLGAAGTAIGFASSDDTTALEDQITALTDERSQLEHRIGTLTGERDDAIRSIEALDADLVRLRSELRAARAEADGLDTRVGELEAEISTVTGERDAALASVEQVGGELTTAKQRLTAAIAERDALAALLPLEFDATLAGRDLVGTYKMKLSQVHCSGFATCGTVPALGTVTISKTAQGWLRLDVGEFAAGGLFQAGDALHMVVDSTTAAPDCNGAPRTARVMVTMFPAAYTVSDAGTADIASLAAVVTVESPATDGCDAGLALYSAQITRNA